MAMNASSTVTCSGTGAKSFNAKMNLAKYIRDYPGHLYAHIFDYIEKTMARSFPHKTK